MYFWEVSQKQSLWEWHCTIAWHSKEMTCTLVHDILGGHTLSFHFSHRYIFLTIIFYNHLCQNNSDIPKILQKILRSIQKTVLRSTWHSPWLNNIQFYRSLTSACKFFAAVSSFSLLIFAASSCSSRSEWYTKWQNVHAKHNISQCFDITCCCEICSSLRVLCLQNSFM